MSDRPTPPRDSSVTALLTSNSHRLPRREVRHLIGGVHQWLSSLSGRGPTLFLGTIATHSAGSAFGLVDALASVCERYGIRLWRGTAVPGIGEPPGIVGELASEVIQSREFRCETVTRVGRRQNRRRSAAEISSELHKLCPVFRRPGLQALPAIDPELDRSRLIDAFCRGLVRESETRPLLVVFENLHSADALSTEVFFWLRRMLWNRRRSQPRPRLLLVATWERESPPDFFGDRDDIDVAASRAFHLEERGFTRQDTQAVARHILGRTLSVTEGERLRKITEGSVLLTLWLLQLWREAGHEVVQRLSAKAVDLRTIVTERLKFLEPDQRRCVELLAAIGTAVPKPELIDAASLSSESSLVELTARDWVTQNSRGESVILDMQTREVILQNLGATARQQVVERAQRLCVQLAQADNRLLARSLSLALANGEGSADSDAAMNVVNYLVTTGCADRALEFVEAIASECVENNHPKQREWRERSVQFLEQTGYYREAIELLRVLRDGERSPDRRAECSRRIGALLGELGEDEEQLREYYSGLQVVLDNDGSRVRAELLACVARSLFATGQESEAYKFLELYEAATERFGDLEPLSKDSLCAPPAAPESAGSILEQFQSLASVVDRRLGMEYCKRDSRNLRRLMSLAKKSGSRVLVARALCRRGHALRITGDKEEALNIFRRAKRLFADCGRFDEAWMTQTHILVLELKQGHLVAARPVVAAVTEGWSSAALDEVNMALPRTPRECRARDDYPMAIDPTTPVVTAVTSHHQLALQLIGSGRIPDAERVLDQELRSVKDCRSESQAREYMLKLLALGRLSSLRGDFDTAMERVLRCLARLESTPDRSILTSAYLEVADVLVERGEMRRALHHLLRAFELAVDVGGTQEGATVFAALARFFLEVREADLASDFLSGAIVLGSRVKAELAPRLLRLRSRLAAHRDDLEAARSDLDLKLAPEEAGGQLETCRRCLEHGWLEYRMGRFAEASDMARRGVELARAIGCEPLLDDMLLLVGVVEGAGWQGKNFLRAVEALDQALAGAESQRRPRLIWEALQAMSQIYRERGKADLADEYTERARAVEREVFRGLPRSWGWPTRLRLPETVGAQP